MLPPEFAKEKVAAVFLTLGTEPMSPGSGWAPAAKQEQCWAAAAALLLLFTSINISHHESKLCFLVNKKALVQLLCLNSLSGIVVVTQVEKEEGKTPRGGCTPL